MKFIIDRSKWRTGSLSDVRTGLGNTVLKNHEGYMCCLGFICEQSGCKDIMYRLSPYALDNPPSFLSQNNRDTKLTNDAMSINDDGEITPEEKEKVLTKLFKEHGIELEFVGEYEIINNEKSQDTKV